MCPVSYSIMNKSKNHRFDLRFHMVRMALKDGVRATARAFKTTRNTVRKWLHRFDQGGPEALSDHSHAPLSCPHKTNKVQQDKVIAHRQRTPGFGAARLKREFELAPSVGAIARIIRQNGLTRTRKKKHHTKRDLRAVKAKYKPLTRPQIDVKYLNDIPHYWPFMKALNLPEFQYTIRCPKLGATFLAYGSELSKTYAELTVKRFLKHIKAHKIDPHDVIVQTDQGSEFDGQTINTSDRGFTFTIENTFGAHHRLIKSHNPNANADVESFHAHEETEFFDVESFSSKKDFWEKITTYQHYWNFGRSNFYKGAVTPAEILTRDAPAISLSVLSLPPIDLDQLFLQGVGHHQPVLTERSWLTQDFNRPTSS